MPKFNEKSLIQLRTCDITLQNLFNEVIEKIDCSIICGHRGEADQNKAVRDGRSKVKFPNSKHNSLPSLAVDVYPYPYNWLAGTFNLRDAIDDGDIFKINKILSNIKKFHYFAGVVRGIALGLGINVRWGGDWDSDNDLEDQDFNDLPHWEVIL